MTMRSAMQAVFLAISVLLVAGLFVQVFLAGLGVFDSATRFATHADFGYMLELLPLLLIIVGLIARVPRRQVGLAVLILLLFFLQSVFVALRTDQPTIAALHPVNGFVITLLAIVLAREAWLMRRASAAASGEPPAPAAS
jgi:uncharacterized protein DUF6220